MSNNSKNDDFLTIRLDDEDRRDRQQSKSVSPQSAQSNSVVNSTSSPQKSGFPVLATFSFIVALSASGAAYYLYEQSLAQSEVIKSAENRILSLERKLSATGEEIGESTVALQVKVNDLSEKTGELWEQMDKLWASAWRRNQKEIADNNAKITRVQSQLSESIDNLTTTSSTQQGKVNSIESQTTALADEVLALNVQLEQLVASQEADDVKEQLSIFEQRNDALSQRITQLENEVKALATKLVSQQNQTSPSVTQ
ncbi:hypothetical protein J3L16_07795 [Alteromonas sp. 5E99-2]|uniref:hypothetical protein n=1 Tax=Alteromonas sp. 5E99-2 TaxID=2817683 RepID=UPI001A98E1BD|nr:hypothetical protein [Alteromonas sp. 5E99-2]MBO1255583.1 hypothetical protein [Alteromonas sp. 5E99-2]